jgi:RimJ/RimL family protein N-acetyltransferase
MRVLEKCGFKEYGVIPEDYYVDGKYYNTHRFYKLQRW